jgi:hypothetical protein
MLLLATMIALAGNPKEYRFVFFALFAAFFAPLRSKALNRKARKGRKEIAFSSC